MKVDFKWYSDDVDGRLSLTDSFNPVVAYAYVCLWVLWFVDDRNDNETSLYDMSNEKWVTIKLHISKVILVRIEL